MRVGGMTWVMVDRDRDAIFSLYWTSLSFSPLDSSSESGGRKRNIIHCDSVGIYARR
jgi:hypothetical protein